MRKKKEHIWVHKGMYLIDKTDPRYEHYKQLRKETGMAPDETWNLDAVIAQFIAPRLKLFIEQTIGCPGSVSSLDEWKRILGCMLEAFELIADESTWDQDSEAKIEHGLDMFREYYHCLWW